jgi:hypothetical protein
MWLAPTRLSDWSRNEDRPLLPEVPPAALASRQGLPALQAERNDMSTEREAFEAYWNKHHTCLDHPEYVAEHAWMYRAALRGPGEMPEAGKDSPTQARPDTYDRFLAWAKPYIWSRDKAAMDLAWMAYSAGAPKEGSTDAPLIDPAVQASEEETLPCPFCGSEDISDGEALTSDPDGVTYTQSECQNCGALGPKGFLEPGEVDYGDAKARAAWSRRPATTEGGTNLPHGAPEQDKPKIKAGDTSFPYLLVGSTDAQDAEPVGHLHSNGDFCVEQMPHELLHHWPVPLYTHPSAQDAELTDEQIENAGAVYGDRTFDGRGRASWTFDDHGIRAYVRAILATRTKK